jgi:nitrite reductase/ring-hydroxylating ferredoxin subunit
MQRLPDIETPHAPDQAVVKIQVATLEDLAEGAATDAAVVLGDGPRNLILTRRGGVIAVFLNSCPHTGVRLDLIPGQFLDVDGTHLQCTTHGALFEPDTGRCVAGPCAGRHLVRIVSEIREGAVYIDGEAPLPESAAHSRR